MPAPDPPEVIRLPRGGAVVRTSAGPVQLGCPPETIKDILAAKLEVPSVFVLPMTWFASPRGLVLAEIEFPVYFNYFVLGRRITVVCDEEGRRRVRAILRESLFGPDVADALDYDPSVPPEARADVVGEGRWFRRNEDDPARFTRLDEVVNFAVYDEAGRVALTPSVRVERRRGERPRFAVLDGERVLADLDEGELAPVPKKRAASPRPFTPPTFGLTVLGASHGFDPRGRTTGFVLWANRRGVLVDPPTDATDLLAAAGVPAAAVDSVILTHCHADHDAGVLQKILEAGRVNLYTTPTILGSFLRKYVAVTGEPEERLRRLFIFRPVTIGAPARIHGAELRFFYSLHSIPTIGFEAFLGGQSFFYSADTLYDPARIEALHQEGVLAAGRRDQLCAFPRRHSIVVHEAGVPPIHTPVARLAALPEEAKRRLYLIHIAEADLPTGAGLRLVPVGFDATLALPVADHPYAEALQVLDALAGIDLLRDFPVERAREFLTIARRERHRAGALVIGQGQPGDLFYIIVAGEATVERGGVHVKTYRAGDFFGETALVTGQPRNANVFARTELDVLTVDKQDFLSFLRGTEVVGALIRLAKNRDLPSWDLIVENPVLRVLGTQQRIRLQAVLEHTSLEPGRVLWQPGAAAEAAWLLDDAVVELASDGHPAVTLGRAAFLGDGDAIVRGRRHASRAACVRGGGAFRIAGEHIAELLETSPALYLALSGIEFVA
jgi:phosphoribosyl 1,2-cyclic phosphodiesterase